MDRKSMRNVHILTLFGSYFTPDVTTEVHCFSNESKIAKTGRLEQKVETSQMLCNKSD